LAEVDDNTVTVTAIAYIRCSVGLGDVFRVGLYLGSWRVLQVFASPWITEASTRERW